MRYVDTNIFIRHLANDDPAQSEACLRFWHRVGQGSERVTTSEAIVSEVCYVLSSPRMYRLSHREVAARLQPLLSLSGLSLANKRSILQALTLYAESPFLDFEDALTVAHMEREGIQDLVSYDQGFDRISGISRSEPP